MCIFIFSTKINSQATLDDTHHFSLTIKKFTDFAWPN